MTTAPKYPKVKLIGYGAHKGRTQTAFLHHIEGTTVHVKVLGDICGSTKIWIDREYSLITGMYTDAESRGWATFSGFKLDLTSIPDQLRAENEKKIRKAERRQKRRATRKVAKKKLEKEIAQAEAGGAVKVFVQGQAYNYPTPKAARKGLRKLGLSVNDATKTQEGDVQIWRI